jgi:hypothetical protein
MRLLDIAAPVVGFAASAQALGTGTGVVGTAVGTGSTVYTTVVVPTYVTVCPEPTTFAYQNVTYTVTQSTTLTITNCPCTLTIHTPPPVTTTSTWVVPPAGSQISSGFQNGTATGTLTTGVVTFTPPPTTGLSGTTAITTTPNPTKTPVGPTATPSGNTPPPVSVSSADKMTLSLFGGLLAAVAGVAFTL